jgi:hypothetical protein
MSRKRRRSKRRYFSLNGLAIQISAFALSFTLVALFVVGSSRAAFVEENETVTERETAATQAEPVSAGPGLPVPARPSTPAKATAEPPVEPVVDTPLPTEEPPAVQEIGLTDDSAGTAMYIDQDGLIPGVPEERCIRVTFDGSVDPQPVMLYSAGVDGSLAPYLDISVEMGTADAGAFGDCLGFTSTTSLFSGTLADFQAAHAAYDAGLVTWDPTAAGESRAFRFSVAVRDDAAAEGLTSTFGLTWEARA